MRWRHAALVALGLGLAASAAAQTVLWDQRDLVSGDGIPDQDFEVELDEFDAEAADDFLVDWPDGWRVEVVRTIGDQSLERTADSVDLAIHADVGGRPAAGAIEGCRADALVPAGEDDGSLELRLPGVCELPPGRYWLSLQVNQPFDPKGQHFWSSRSATRGNPALWRNPADGFDTGCRDWDTLAACGVGGSFPDLLFALEGALLDPPPIAVGGVDVVEGGASNPAVAVAPSGLRVLAWRRGDRLEMRRFDDRGRPVGVGAQMYRGAVAGAPVAGIDEVGGVAAAWERPSGGIQARFFDEAGNPTRNAFQVVSAGRAPALARGPEGLTAIAWHEDDGGVLARLYDRDGNALGSPIAVDAGTGRSVAVAMGRDGFWTVSWVGADASLRVRTFGPNGGSFGGEQIAIPSVDPTVRPLVVARGARTLTLAWAASGELLAQAWEAGVGPSGAAETVAVVGTSPVGRLSGGGNGFGETALAWQLDTGGNARVFTRVLGIDGVPIGSGLDLGFGRDGVAAAIDPAGQVLIVAEQGADVAVQRLLLRPSDCDAGFVQCLGGAAGDRFAVRVSWKAFDRTMGLGIPQRLTADTGWFWFFGPDNVEVVLKVLDGRALNDAFWVFYAALSNVEFTVSVVDRETETVAIYHNLEGRFASVGDTDAFPEGGEAGIWDPGSAGDRSAGFPDLDTGAPLSESRAPDPGSGVPSSKAGPCVPSDTVLCLVDGRMRVTTAWEDFDGNTGVGHARTLAGETTGYFWFFNEANVEVVTKVLDGRGLNGKFWVFVASLSNVDFSITVEDLETGVSRTYVNPAGTFASFADTEAL